eukprot:CAMPEP_0119483590 /NCGR_PEP_ID=MMETSP1344-20130328/10929_1 /TAXON_ID=236787 /ORGANISM="Florenciella parvula, Strain CCMP2471" /LENGTH=162 /DNA_ID=CAMNT_0007518095 /DNA_START=578 /DNA_END=1066 /DNA_ORIENTATION=-
MARLLRLRETKLPTSVLSPESVFSVLHEMGKYKRLAFRLPLRAVLSLAFSLLPRLGLEVTMRTSMTVPKRPNMVPRASSFTLEVSMFLTTRSNVWVVERVEATDDAPTLRLLLLEAFELFNAELMVLAVLTDDTTDAASSSAAAGVERAARRHERQVGGSPA